MYIHGESSIERMKSNIDWIFRHRVGAAGCIAVAVPSTPRPPHSLRLFLSEATYVAGGIATVGFFRVGAACADFAPEELGVLI